MRLAALFASAFAVFAFQCGGQTDEPCPSSPNEACIQEGKACDFPTTYCDKPITETCTCKNGAYECPALAGDCPIDVCATDTYPGSSCSVKGAECPSMVQPACTNGPIMCTCDGQQFQCAIPDCPPTPICPPPDSITPGAACTPMDGQCNGPNDSQCVCTGTWACTLPLEDAGPPDAGSD